MIALTIHCEGLFTASFPVLARIYGGSCKLLQGNIPDNNKLSSTRRTCRNTLSAASTDVVSIFTHFDLRCHGKVYCHVITDRTDTRLYSDIKLFEVFVLSLPLRESLLY